MRQAVIVSQARTPIGRAYRGAFNLTPAPTLAAHAIAAAVARAGIDPAEVEDVILGAALQQGGQAPNIARLAALRAGLPVSVAGMSVDRQCASGMMAIAIASNQIVQDGMAIVVAGGVESISTVQTEALRMAPDPALVALHPAVHMPMLDTAETVAQRTGIARAAMDDYALQSQQRTAAAQAAGRFDAEIVPMATVMAVTDKATGAISHVPTTLARDEGNRADTTLAGLAALKPVRGPAGTITAGNASQLSDGAAALVLMAADDAARRGLAPPGGLPGHCRGRAGAGRDGHRPGVRGAPIAGAPRAGHRRYRLMGAERGVRGAGAVLPRPAGPAG